MEQVEIYAVIAAAVLAVNLLPAFGPPTWAVLVLFHLHQDVTVPLLVLVGALSAASGRILLALATRRLGDYLPAKHRANIEAAGELLTRRPGESVAALALFAVSPVPSAQLFEAAGLMKVRLLPLTAAFFAGRTVSYALYLGGAHAVGTTDTGKLLLSSLTSPWGLAWEIGLIAALVLLARVDWTKRLHSGSRQNRGSAPGNSEETMVEIAEVLVADEPEAWAAAGFRVDADGGARIGSVRIRLVGREHGLGIVGWSLRGVPADLNDVDGVPTQVCTEPAAEPAVHPNGVVTIDHLVLLSPDLARTVAALGGLGVEPRRERDGELGGQTVRQVFFPFGDVILEVVGSPGTTSQGPSTMWGLTYVVADLDSTETYFGDGISAPKDAVQPGRRIATLRHRQFDLSVRTALITPHQRSGS